MTTNPLITTYTILQTAPTDGWLASDWAAGQTSIMNWEDQNVRTTATGTVELTLAAAPAGSSRPFNGAEVQSKEVATTGTWSWTAQAPKMVDGAVFGMFTYKADWQTQPWVEFDFEFVGSDTTKVQLNIHMEDANGHHISLAEAIGKPVIVDLGFDASQGMHTYDVVVTDKTATFRIDGKVVGVYGAADMPGGVWQIGPQKSYVDLWCASGLDSWAGKWAYDGNPLVARVQGADVRPGDLTGALSSMPAPTTITTPTAPAVDLTGAISGDDQPNLLTGGDANDTLNGNSGNDTLTGGNGQDSLFGGDGNDVLRLDAGNDSIDGGNGIDTVEVAGTSAATIDLALSVAQSTGYGSDTLRNVENVSGGAGNDLISGNDLGNRLTGNSGNDTLSGRNGDDTLLGGAGDDSLTGGTGHDKLYGEDGNDRMSLGAGDDLIDGGAGYDWVTVTGITAATVDLSRTSAQNTGFGTDTIRNVENVAGNAGADRLTGDALANILLGNGGSDTLSGGAGADTLTGGAGRDLLSGGIDADRDVFVFNTASESAVGSQHDTIGNFVTGVDDIDLRGIDANTRLSGNQAFAFSGSVAGSHLVWAVASGADTLIRADINGDRVADFEVLVTGNHGFGAGDFLL